MTETLSTTIIACLIVAAFAFGFVLGMAVAFLGFDGDSAGTLPEPPAPTGPPPWARN